jgi:glycosyltransferase involved in cell wall biosynthesis
MKILHVGNLKSGIDTYVRNTVALVDDRFEFVIANGADDNNEPYIRKGKEVKNYHICLYRALNPIKDLKALWQTIKIIRQEKPDLVHCHSAKGGVIGRFAAYLTRTKSLYTPHAFSFLSTDSNKKRKIYLLMEKIAKLNSCLLACSESEKELGMNMIPYPKGKAFAWPNAIPSINNSEIILPKDVKENEKFIISVGRPSYQKNPLLMVETVKLIHERHPEVMFILVGVGYYSPMLDNMKSLIEKYKLQNVIKLIPWCSHEETLGYVSRAMFYMTTSLYEGLPIAVLEAMALGKPIVASDVIGNKDCVKDKYNGFLLPLEASTFAEYCNELLENEGLLQQMGQQSKLYFEQHFLIDKRIKDLENIYINVSSIK